MNNPIIDTRTRNEVYYEDMQRQRDGALALVSELREALKGANAQKARLLALLREDAMWCWDMDYAPETVEASYPTGGSLTSGPNNNRAFWQKRKAALNADEGKGSK